MPDELRRPATHRRLRQTAGFAVLADRQASTIGSPIFAIAMPLLDLTQLHDGDILQARRRLLAGRQDANAWLDHSVRGIDHRHSDLMAA